MADLTPYNDVINAAAQQYNVDPDLVRAQITVESGGNPKAVSPVGAMGLMQLMPGTAKQYGAQNPMDPVQNIFAGTRYLAHNIQQYGDVGTALMAYHGGDDQSGWGPKTRAYPTKVSSVFQSLKSAQQPQQDSGGYVNTLDATAGQSSDSGPSGGFVNTLATPSGQSSNNAQSSETSSSGDALDQMLAQRGAGKTPGAGQSPTKTLNVVGGGEHNTEAQDIAETNQAMQARMQRLDTYFADPKNQQAYPDDYQTYLAEKRASQSNDLDSMLAQRAAGKDVAKAPTPQQQPAQSNGGLVAAGQFGSGANEGIANTLGLPVDLVTRGLNMLPGVNIQNPVLGSQWIMQHVMPQPLPESSDIGGRLARGIGKGVGSGVAGAGVIGGMAAGLQSSAPVMNGILSGVRSAPLPFLGQSAYQGAASGLSGQVAHEAFPNSPYAETVGSMLPMAPGAVANIGRNVVRSNGWQDLIKGAPQGTANLNANIAAADRAGTSLSAGQATGNNALNWLEATTSKLPGGAGPFAQRGAAQGEEMGNKVGEIVSGLAPNGTSAEIAGRTIQSGIQNFVNRFKGKANTLYNQVGQYIPGNTAVGVSNTDAALSRLTQPVAGADNLSEVLTNPKVKQIYDAFTADTAANGTLPYQTLSGLRTKVGDMLSSPDLISDVPRGQLKQLYGAISQDMETAAAAQGPDALKAYQRANQHYQAGIQRIDDFLQNVTNKASPEKAFQLAMSGTEQGATQLRTIMKSLTPDERNVVAGAVVQRLGRATNGVQNAEGTIFSPQTFLTNWNKLSPQAKTALVSGSLTLRQDLDAIAKTASNIRDGSSVLKNTSGSAAAAINAGALGSAATAALTGNLKTAAGIAGVAGLSNVTARMLTNPTFVRWLAKTSRMSPGALQLQAQNLLQATKNSDPSLRADVQNYLGGLVPAH